MARRMAVSVTLVLLLTVCSAPASAWPVVLLGIDAEDSGHGPLSVYEDVVVTLLNRVNQGSAILVLGGGKSGSDEVTTFWDDIEADLGVNVAYANGDELATASFVGYSVIVVVSPTFQGVSGGLTQAENDLLEARSGDLAAFVQGGGGLLGFTQAGLLNSWTYLRDLATIVDLAVDFDNITPTQEGAAWGLTDELDVCCWHEVFEGVLAPHTVLATGNFGRSAAVAIEPCTTTAFQARFPLGTGGSQPQITGPWGGDATVGSKTYEGHLGEDYAASLGTEVYAAGCGEVCEVKANHPSWGNYVVIRHGLPDGTMRHTLYAHLSELLVSEGEELAAGHLVGLSGNTGTSGGPHLHFGVLDEHPCKPGKGYSGENFPEETPEVHAFGGTYFNPTAFIQAWQ